MIVEVDQSIKIERTHQDTVIGIASKTKMFAAVVPRHTKRKLQTAFREAGVPRLFVYRTFVATVVLTLVKSDWKNISDVVIDVEYKGQEQRIRSIFLEMWSRVRKTIPDISFREIGKRSPAHQVCYAAMKKKRRADTILTFGEIKRLALK